MGPIAKQIKQNHPSNRLFGNMEQKQKKKKKEDRNVPFNLLMLFLEYQGNDTTEKKQTIWTKIIIAVLLIIVE